MAKIKDGWHTIYGKFVYVENGRVLRGVSSRDWDQRTIYPYRVCRDGCTNCAGITVDAFRSGLRRGTVTML